ncbi:rRNA adenine N-6-methyltransferase family protein, partial [Haemophilus haemolyticus]|uniref:rRNA adenine N-6-methyltransferase family protein n=1 Tax=Haemophilus haemolyticus TaxID=726 RepID=UPI0023AAA05E
MKEHKARKRFGQNFLQDTRIISDIVNAVRPQADDVVIEIGPGLAAITEPLAKKLNRLHVVEIDREHACRLLLE